jgi:hypothetical protein
MTLPDVPKIPQIGVKINLTFLIEAKVPIFLPINLDWTLSIICEAISEATFFEMRCNLK